MLRSLLAALSVLLALAALWCTTGTDAETARAAAVDAVASSAPASDVESDALESDRPRACDARVGGREEREVPPFGPELELLFVDDHRRPLALATAFVWDPPSGARSRVLAEGPTRGDPAGEAESNGVRHVADERGVVAIPRPSRAILVAAKSDDRAGLARVGPDQASPIVIELRPRAELRVRVVDDRSSPLADVALELRDGYGDDAFWCGTTDADGSIAIASTAARPPFPCDAYVLVASFLGARDAVHLCPPDFAAASPIEIRVPRSPPIEIAFVDERGDVMPIDDELVVDLGVLSLGAPRMVDAIDRARVPVREGVARLLATAGDETIVNLSLAFHEGEWALEREPGDAWRERVELRLDPEARWRRVTVLGEDGLPSSERVLQLAWTRSARQRPDGERADWQPLQATSVRTDRAGRIALPSAVDPPGTWRSFVFDDGSTIPLAAEIPTGSTAPVAVQLVPAPVLARGRVVDEGGAPLAFARVTLLEPRPESSPCEPPLYRPIVADANGAFVAYAPRVAGRWLPSVELDGEYRDVIAPTEAFEWGTEGLEVRVASTGSIEARFLLDEDVDHDAFWVDAIDADGDLPGRNEWWRDGEGWRLRVRGLAPGAYALAFGAQDVEEPASRVDDVRVEAGATTRLAPIDFRGALRPPPRETFRTIRVTSLAGTPISHGFAAWEEPDGEDWTWPLPWFGAARVPATSKHVALWSAGHRVLVRETPATAVTWSLEPAFALDLVLDVPRTWSHAGIAFTASIGAGEMDRALRYFVDAAGTCAFDVNGRASFELPEPGTWRIEVRASWTTRGETQGVAFEGIELAIDEQGPRGTTTLRPDASAWAVQLHEAGAPIPER